MRYIFERMNPIKGFPDEFVPVEQKLTEEYGLQWADGIYSRRLQGGFSIYTTGSQYWFMLMHQYAEGTQDAGQYVNVYRGVGTFRTKDGNNNQDSNAITEGAVRDFDRKGLNNISFEVKTFAPKFVSTVKSLMQDADVQIDIDSISPEAMRKKELEKWRMYYGSRTINPLRKQAGVPLKQFDWQPQNKEELELYEKNHGFKMPMETGLKKILEHTLHISQWQRIFDQWKDAQIIERFICAKVCCNDEGAVTVETFPVSEYVTDYLEKQPLDEPTFAGHVVRKKIQEVAGVLIQKGVPQEEILALAKNNAAINGVTSSEIFDWQACDPVTNRFLWYDFYVNVLCFQVRSTDREYYRKYRKQNGDLKYARVNPKVDPDTKKYYYDNANNKNTIETDKFDDQMVYEGEWVIGTKRMLKWGKKAYVIRTSDGQACLDYFHISTKGQSIMERVKPNLDQYMMNWLKYQAHVLAAMPPGGTVDVGVLALMDFGWGEIQGPDWLRIARETGWKFLQSNEMMMKNRINPAAALTSEDNGPGDGAFKWLELMAAQINDAREMVGLTGAVEATPKKGPQLVGLMEGEIMATGHALYEDNQALVWAKQLMASKVVALARMVLEEEEKSREYYSGVIGPKYVKEINIYKDASINQIGLRIRTAVTKERKERLRMMIDVALSEGRNGVRLIDFEDALLMEKYIEEGYLDWAIWYFGITKQRNAKKQQALAEADMKRNAEVQMQSAQAAEQAKRETAQLLEQLKTNRELTLEERKGMIQSALSKQEHLQRMAELNQEGYWETVKAAQRGQDTVEISGQL